MSEKELIQKCQQGRLEEFDKLYLLYFEKIYSFVYYKTMHKQIAQDITSETFLKALEGIKGFKTEKGSFSAWIYRIARNNVIDYYRKKDRSFSVNDFWDFKTESKIEDNKDLMIKVKKELAKLEPLQREIVILRIWQQLNYKEISEIVGKKEQNCRVIFCRSLQKIRKEIILSIFLLSLTL
jgi:RNA polymerase sigma factor (sigma-70 family)